TRVRIAIPGGHTGATRAPTTWAGGLTIRWPRPVLLRWRARRKFTPRTIFPITRPCSSITTRPSHDGSGPEMKAAPQSRWRRAWLVYTRPSALRMLFLGFSAGLPFMLVFATLTAWLRDAGVSRTAIGFFAWIGITYSIKVFWSP